jgi:hypothetical protein
VKLQQFHSARKQTATTLQGHKQQLQAHSARKQATASTLSKETNNNCKHTLQGNKQHLQAHSARKPTTTASTLCKETNRL